LTVISDGCNGKTAFCTQRGGREKPSETGVSIASASAGPALRRMSPQMRCKKARRSFPGSKKAQALLAAQAEANRA